MDTYRAVAKSRGQAAADLLNADVQAAYALSLVSPADTASTTDD